MYFREGSVLKTTLIVNRNPSLYLACTHVFVIRVSLLALTLSVLACRNFSSGRPKVTPYQEDKCIRITILTKHGNVSVVPFDVIFRFASLKMLLLFCFFFVLRSSPLCRPGRTGDCYDLKKWRSIRQARRM